jgi:aspartate-semialdehyde dehydrogenase
VQRRNHGWNGAIVTNPNCSTITMALGLAALKPFGITRILASTMQAVSGAGYPGMPSMDILGNVVPYIDSEEEKIESETQKILGDYNGDSIRPLAAKVSAHCNRVAVIDGHTVAVSVALDQKAGVGKLEEAFRSFRGRPQELELPSAPKQPIHLMAEQNRPQPRKDALRERGMAVSVGRVRECPVLDYKFVVLGHNTIRGAAGAAVLNAELMLSEGLLD